MAQRKLLISRNILQNCDGSASSRLGHSYCLAGVKAEIAVPYSRSPAVGRLEVIVDFPKISGADFRPVVDLTNNMAHFISSTLREILESRSVLDPSCLIIRDREAAWVLNVHIICMAYDGAPIDLALAAAVAALEDTVLPGLEWDSSKGWYRRRLVVRGGSGDRRRPDQIGGVDEGRAVLSNPGEGPMSPAESSSSTEVVVYEGCRVRLLSRPISVTFVNVLDMAWVVDPCREEESLGDGITLCRVGDGWVTIRLGGSDIADMHGVLRYLSGFAAGIVTAMDEAIANAVDVDEELVVA